MNQDWTLLDAGAAIAAREYSFRPGASATTLVFRGADGLVVVSPEPDPAPGVLDALAELGPVRALVANNPFHHLGQRAFRARFPEAKSYAPSGAIPRLTKQTGGVPFEPLSALPLPPGLACEEAAGFRWGEAILRLPSAAGTVWYTGDLLVNIQQLPSIPARWLFTWTGSAPGFRLFKPAAWLLVKDRRAAREWMLERLRDSPPALVVPAHGPPLAADDLADRARRELARL